MDVVNPLSIILVKSDSKGDRLLFRYPYNLDTCSESSKQKRRRNPYSMSVHEDILQSPPPQVSNVRKGKSIYSVSRNLIMFVLYHVPGQLCGFTDEVLSTLFAVKPELCNRKFELKVNDVRFVAHPTLMQSRETKDDQQQFSSILINIVFALHAQASYSIVKCYYELSKRLGHALVYEEKRVGYLSDEMKLMVKTHDEISSVTEHDSNAQQTLSAFDLILERSTMAQCLKSVNILSIGKKLQFILTLDSVDIPRSLHDRIAEHHHQSMGDTELLSAPEGSSVPQKGRGRRAGSH